MFYDEEGFELYINDNFWGMAIEYNPRYLNNLRGLHLSDEQIDNIANEIDKFGPSTNMFDALGYFWLDDFQWSTGMDFGRGYEGGGYHIGFGLGDCEPIIIVLVEWNDSFIGDEYQEERSSQHNCVVLGLHFLNYFLEEISK